MMTTPRRTTAFVAPIPCVFARGLSLALCCSLGPAALLLCPVLPAQSPDAPSRSSLPATTSSLPATAPTGSLAQTTPLPASANGAASARATRAQVTFSGGLLGVRANNSSLNGILREVSRTTGMKLTGVVAEQRVFGNYGPAAPATVLATLLDGAGSNMLLRESGDAAAPTELILTPRLGGPSPPAPASSIAEDEDNTAADAVPNTLPGGVDPTVYGRHGSIGAGLPPSAGVNGVSGPRSLGQPQNNVNGSPYNTSPTASSYPITNSVPLDTVPTPSTTPSVSGIVDAPNPPPPGTTTSVNNGAGGGQIPGVDSNAITAASGAAAANTGQNGAAAGTADPTNPNEPKTPEQVYQLLQQLRQQSEQQNHKPQ